MTKILAVVAILVVLIGACWFCGSTREYEYQQQTSPAKKAEHIAMAKQLQKANIGDWVVYPNGTFASVQGSEMSGKSVPVRSGSIHLRFSAGDIIAPRSILFVSRADVRIVTPQEQKAEWDELARKFMNVKQ